MSSATAPAAAMPAKELPFPEPLISRQNFTDWGKACRVRKIKDKYDEMLDKAADENLSLEQYQNKNGMQDRTAFFLSCPQFDMFCWPSELAELGSGFVLYFHFLIFLIIFLFLSFFVQMPAVMEYWDEDNFDKWAYRKGEPDTEVLSSSFIYTSPGMLGPRVSDSAEVPFCYFVLVCFLCAAVVVKSAWQLRVDALVDADTTQPNDFAIMVEGLPATATDEEAIAKFFRENAVRGKNDTEIVKVVVGYDAKIYREMMKALKEAEAELSRIPPLHPRVQELMDKTKQIRHDLMSAAPDTTTTLTSSGVAVVSFRYQTDLRRCLDRWQSLWATWAYRDWGGCCGLCGGPALARFPTASGVGVWKIKVQRAPNPGDMNWDDLGVDRNERFKMLARTNGIMVLVIAISTVFCYAAMKMKEGSTGAWTSVLPAIAIAVANGAVAQCAKKFGDKEYHNTKTEQEGSQAIKMTLGMIANTAIVILALNPKDLDWYKADGLVRDVLYLVGVTAVGQPLFQYFDMKYWTMGAWMRSKVSDAEIKRLRDGAESYNAQGVTQSTLSDFKDFKKEYVRTVAYYNAAYEPSEMDMKRRYAYAVRTFVCCMCYCHLIPFISLVGIMGIVVQYVIDKKMLLRWYKRPSSPQGIDQAKMSLFFLRFTTLLMPLCMWFFISPSYEDQSNIVWWMALSYLPAVGLCCLPIATIRHVLSAPCRGRNRARVAIDDREDYYTAQYMWPRALKYHKSHSLYAGLPEAKNPEFLDENTSSFTKIDDVKTSYGASAAAAAAATSAPAAGMVRLAGGVAMGGTVSSGGDGKGGDDSTVLASPSDPSLLGATKSDPSIIGATSKPAVVAVDATILPGDGGDDPKHKTGGGGGGGGRRGGGPVWEMDLGSGWSKFDHDCHDHMEKQYQKFKSGHGEARITIRTKGIALSLDYEKMTQMRKGKGKNKVNKIRRSEGP